MKPAPSIARHRTSRRHCTVAALLLLLLLPGCSLGVMFGKMFFGDPKITSQFRSATGVDLTKGEKSLLIVCTAPHGTIAAYPSVHIDLVDRMTRQLEVRKVNVVDSDDVAAWLDDHGDWEDFSELAAHFDADFVMHIDLATFRCKVPDSPNLLQGRADGKVVVYRTQGKNTESGDVRVAFERAFDVTYPQYPTPRDKSEEIFFETFIDRTSESLSRFLYDYRVSESME